MYGGEAAVSVCPQGNPAAAQVSPLGAAKPYIGCVGRFYVDRLLSAPFHYAKGGAVVGGGMLVNLYEVFRNTALEVVPGVWYHVCMVPHSGKY